MPHVGMFPADAKIFVKNLPADIKEKEVRYIFSKYGSVQKADVIMWPGPPVLALSGSLETLQLTVSSRQKLDWQACAFVVYSTADAASMAIRALNGIYRPRTSSPEPLAVMLARPGALPEPVQSGLAPVSATSEELVLIGSSGGAVPDRAGNNFSLGPTASATASYIAEKTKCKLFIGNLHAEIPKERVSAVFGEWGRVLNVHVMTGKSKFGSACAFVEMATPPEADAALKGMHQKYEPRIGSMTAPVTVTYFQSQSSGKAAQSASVPGSGKVPAGFSRYTPYTL